MYKGMFYVGLYMSLFIGRQAELDELKRQADKKIARLIVIKGRRRIGKSRLIEEFCKHYRHYIFAGLPPTNKTTKESQLNELGKSRQHYEELAENLTRDVSNHGN